MTAALACPRGSGQLARALATAPGLGAVGGCPPAIIGWELANEPSFRGTDSAHARASFAAWLRREYDDDLGALRAAWRGGDGAYATFEAAAEAGAPAARPTRTAELPAGTGPAAVWADWSAFNAHRVTRWQRRAASLLWEAGRCHRTMAKLNHANTIDARTADHGIDTPAQVALHNITAFDSVSPNPSVSSDPIARANPIPETLSIKGDLDTISRLNSFLLSLRTGLRLPRRGRQVPGVQDGAALVLHRRLRDRLAQPVRRAELRALA